MGGPSSASRKRAMTFVVTRFLPFLPPQPTTDANYTHYHHLTCIQTRAGGGSYICQGPTTTNTSLASKREPAVSVSTHLQPPPSLHLSASRRWIFSTLSTHLPPPPPPSRPNAIRRWIFLMFSTCSPLPPPSCPNASQTALVATFIYQYPGLV